VANLGKAERRKGDGPMGEKEAKRKDLASAGLALVGKKVHLRFPARGEKKNPKKGRGE